MPPSQPHPGPCSHPGVCLAKPPGQTQRSAFHRCSPALSLDGEKPQPASRPGQLLGRTVELPRDRAPSLKWASSDPAGLPSLVHPPAAPPASTLGLASTFTGSGLSPAPSCPEEPSPRFRLILHLEGAPLHVLRDSLQQAPSISSHITFSLYWIIPINKLKIMLLSLKEK